MTTDEFNRHAAARRTAIASGTLHPASLIGLAQDRLRRIAESRDARPDWRDQHDAATAAALAVLAEGKAATAAFNAGLPFLRHQPNDNASGADRQRDRNRKHGYECGKASIRPPAPMVHRSQSGVENDQRHHHCNCCNSNRLKHISLLSRLTHQRRQGRGSQHPTPAARRNRRRG